MVLHVAHSSQATTRVGDWVTGDSGMEEWREYWDHVREDGRSGMQVGWRYGGSIVII